MARRHKGALPRKGGRKQGLRPMARDGGEMAERGDAVRGDKSGDHGPARIAKRKGGAKKAARIKTRKFNRASRR